MISKNVIGVFVTTGVFQVHARKLPEYAISPKELNEYKKNRAILHIKCSVHLQATLLMM